MIRDFLLRTARRGAFEYRTVYWHLVLGDRLRAVSSVRFGANLRLKPRGRGRIYLGQHVELEYDVNLESWGDLRIGAHTFVGHGTTIGCTLEVVLGNDCLIGEYVSIRDNDHAFDSREHPTRLQGSRSAPVIIENNVWIGAKATIVRGVRIGTGSVIGANAVVTHDIPPFVVAAGIPARVIRQRG